MLTLVLMLVLVLVLMLVLVMMLVLMPMLTHHYRTTPSTSHSPWALRPYLIPI